VKPLHQKVVSSTGEYLEQVADVAKRNKDFVEKRTRDTVGALVAKAEHAIDLVLPPSVDSNGVQVDEQVTEDKIDDEQHQAQKGDKIVQQRKNHDGQGQGLTKKVASRLLRRVTEVCAYSADRAKQIVHIDLIAYAKATLGADEKKIAAVFDKAVSLLPTLESSSTLAEKVVARCPKTVQPVLKRGAAFAYPIVEMVFATLISTILFCRAFVVQSSCASAPLPVSPVTDMQEETQQPQHQESQQSPQSPAPQQQQHSAFQEQPQPEQHSSSQQPPRQEQSEQHQETSDEPQIVKTDETEQPTLCTNPTIKQSSHAETLVASDSLIENGDSDLGISVESPASPARATRKKKSGKHKKTENGISEVHHDNRFN
jgi:hypothetical protein